MTAETIPTYPTHEVSPLDSDVPYSPDESSPLYDQLQAEQTASVESSNDTREVSPTGATLVRAAQRINGLLERRAVNKAHGDALKEYRDRDHSGYVDHIADLKDSEEATPMARATAEMALESEYRKADSKELLEKTKTKIRGFGTSALSRLKNAGRLTVGLPVVALDAGINGVKRASEAMGDATIRGFEKVENGMDKVGNKIVDTKANVKEKYQTFQFNQETKSNQKQFKKEYAKEMKAFDQQAADERKLQAKIDKWESKLAAKEDRRFERSMRKKAGEEKKAARKARWADRRNTIKEAIVSAPEKAGDAMMAGFGKLENGMDRVGARMVDAKETASDKVERAKASVHTTRAAGRAALEAFRTTRQAHTEQNKLY